MKGGRRAIKEEASLIPAEEVSEGKFEEGKFEKEEKGREVEGLHPMARRWCGDGTKCKFAELVLIPAQVVERTQ